LSAGGAEEAVAWPERLLWAAFPSSVLGTPVELHGGSDVPLASATRRSCETRFPSPESVVEDPVVEDLVGVDVVDQAGAVRGAGWRRFGAEDRRLPGRMGAPPSPSFVQRSGGGFRRRSVLRDEDDAGAQKDLCVIFLCSGFFCKNLG
jgi:hypothetical protein